MPVIRIDVVDASDADVQLADLGEATFARADDLVAVACESTEEWLTSLLARAGARATPIAALPAPPTGAIPATAIDLTPVSAPGIVDVIRVRTLTSGEATARLRSARGRWPVRRPDRDSIRAVLRDEDRLIAWRRIVWANPATFRSRAMRGVRPMVFDRGGVAEGRERTYFAAHGELARWLGI